MIPATFITEAADLLGATSNGLSGGQIIKYCSAYAHDFEISLPFPDIGSISRASNKRSALRDNILAFKAEQQFKILKELSELETFSKNSEVREFRTKLFTRYGALAVNTKEEINESLVHEIRHWLEMYPDSLRLYNEALGKLSNKVHQRNLLDDLRLSLELLLKSLFSNDKSLENQLSNIGIFVSDRGGSKELSNMLQKLIDYYGKYQNSYIKHNDLVNYDEMEIIFEITSSFMKFLSKLNNINPRPKV